MKITPAKNHIQLKIEEATAGILDTSSANISVEYAEIIAVGEGVEGYKVGDKVFFKSWAVDIITFEGERYYFLDIATNGIKAKVN